MWENALAANAKTLLEVTFVALADSATEEVRDCSFCHEDSKSEANSLTEWSHSHSLLRTGTSSAFRLP